ncbi:MAG: hypothetical protein [Arizlama microvirus]|nr:MAG: hypothetical protein [Arizlama microvirus]
MNWKKFLQGLGLTVGGYLLKVLQDLLPMFN